VKPRLLISACLLGTACRYDGKSKPVPQVSILKSLFHLIPICPEVDGGLPIPRLPCELQKRKAIREDGTDMTDFYQKGADLALQKAIHCRAVAAVLKEKSPSCGSHLIYDGRFQKVLIPGKGIAADHLEKSGIPIFSENEIEALIALFQNQNGNSPK